MSTNEVKLEVIHSSAGAISETDVTLASASKASSSDSTSVRNPRPRSSPRKKASRSASTPSSTRRSTTCAKRWKGCSRRPIARSRWAAPKCARPSSFRAPRSPVRWWSTAKSPAADARAWCATAAWSGKARSASLKRFKDDAREVLAGYECGIGLENFNDVKPGDVIEDFEMEAVLRKLAPSRRADARIRRRAEKQLQP